MGLTIGYRGEELIKHFQSRIEYHQKQAAYFRAQAEDRIGAGLGSVSNSAVVGSQRQAEWHDRSAAKFKLLAERIDPVALHQLDLSELFQLEVLDLDY